MENYNKGDLKKKRKFRLDSSGSEKEARVHPRETFNRFLGSKQEGRLDDQMNSDSVSEVRYCIPGQTRP